MLKELQSNIVFASKLFNKASKSCFLIYLIDLRWYLYLYLQCKAQSNYMVIILKLFLFNDTSFIKIGVCYQELLSLEFNFHYLYSKHSVI